MGMASDMWLVWIPWLHFIEFCHHDSFKAYSTLPLPLIPNCALAAHSFQHFIGAFIASVLLPPFIVNILYSCVPCLKYFLYLFVLICNCIPPVFLPAHLISPCPSILCYVSCYSVPHQKCIFFICFWTMLHHLLFVTAIHQVVTSLVCSLFHNSSAL